MRKYMPFLILSLFAVMAFGQTNTNIIALTNGVPVSSDTVTDLGTGWLLTLIPLLTPLIIATFKYFLPMVPKVILPVMAPLIGIAIDQINGLIPGNSANPIYGAVLGGAGVALREIYDQTKKLIPSEKA